MLSDQVFPTPDKFFAQLLLIFLNAKHCKTIPLDLGWMKLIRESQ